MNDKTEKLYTMLRNGDVSEAECLDLWNDWHSQHQYQDDCICMMADLASDIENWDRIELLETFATGGFNFFHEYYKWNGSGNPVSSDCLWDLIDTDEMYEILVGNGIRYQED